ncbi:MAG: hypothetical protein ABIB47_03190 [Candidatus Woesearchaeota archaeon]
MKKFRNKKSKVSFIKFRIIFIVVLLVWIVGLDALILDTLSEREEMINYNPKFQNSITGSFGMNVASPTREQALPHLIIFDLIIAVSFLMSYISWEYRKKKVIKKR